METTYEVKGSPAPEQEVQPLFSVDVTSPKMLEEFLKMYQHMGLIPGAETFEITETIPNGKKHEYHVPRLLVSYALNSYEKYLERTSTV